MVELSDGLKSSMFTPPAGSSDALAKMSRGHEFKATFEVDAFAKQYNINLVKVG